MNKLMVCMCVLFLAFSQIALSTAVLAQDPEEKNEEDDDGGFFGGQWSLGVGGEFETNPYKDADDEVMPLPLLTYHGKRFFLEGLSAGFQLIDWNDLEISVIGQYQMKGYEADDSVFLQGMDERKGTFEMGLNLEYEILFGELSLTAVSDVLGRHKGQQVSLEYGIEFEIEKLTLEPYVGVEWQSSKLADYYYGVKVTEARSWRPYYEVDSVINPCVGLGISYSFSEHWMIMGDISYEMLDDDIEKSPIVEDDWSASFFIGLIYSF